MSEPSKTETNSPTIPEPHLLTYIYLTDSLEPGFGSPPYFGPPLESSRCFESFFGSECTEKLSDPSLLTQ